jgi:hypothetical protein
MSLLPLRNRKDAGVLSRRFCVCGIVSGPAAICDLRPEMGPGRDGVFRIDLASIQSGPNTVGRSGCPWMGEPMGRRAGEFHGRRPKALRFILGDQLSRGLSSLEDARPDTDVIFMAEVMEEATSVRHHKKKIAFLFSAMRHFAEDLRDEGFTVDYLCLDARSNPGDFGSALAEAVQRHDAPGGDDRTLRNGGCSKRRRAGARNWTSDLDIRPIPVSWRATRILSWATKEMAASENACGWSISIARCGGAPAI